MKKVYILSMLFLVAVASLLSSCKKDAENGPKKTKTELITGKNWKISDYGMSSSGISQSLFNYYYEACEKDDMWVLKTDKTAHEDAGVQKCDTSDPQTSPMGTWSFNADETTLTITDDSGNTNVFTIKELTATSLKLTQTEIGITSYWHYVGQ